MRPIRVLLDVTAGLGYLFRQSLVAEIDHTMMLKPLSILYRNRHIIMSTSFDTIRQRYAASYMGLAWMVLYPLIFLGIYAFIYINVFQIKLPGHSSFEYTLLIFAGLIPFLGFSEALGAGVGSVVENKALARNTVFPLELVPVKTVIASSTTMLVGLITILAILISSGHVSLSQLIMPIVVLLQLVFTIGLIWLLSMLNVFFRDISTLVAPLIMFLMLISPIAYTYDMIPPNMMPFMYPNPLFYMIMIYRDALYYGIVPWKYLLVFSTISIAVFILGFRVFSRLKAICVDYV